MICVCIINFTFTSNKWSTVFKYYTAAASPPVPVIVIPPLTSMCTSL